MARVLMGVVKDRHGTWYARVKVPVRLQSTVARVLGQGKDRQVFLKKSLGTKDLKTANVRAKSVLTGFDLIIHKATALGAPQPVPVPRTSLNAAEIARMSEALFGKMLADDEALRFGGRAHWAKMLAWCRREYGDDFAPADKIEDIPEFGWTSALLLEQKENLAMGLEGMQDALARGDITAVVDDVDLLLLEFQIALDRTSASYRELGMQALRSYVRALQAIERRNAGEPIDTPKFTLGPSNAPEAGGTLRVAFDGWVKYRQRPDNSVKEYRRAVDMFTELHGDLPVSSIKRSHVLRFREALQEVPRRRQGGLLKATLPDVSAWGRKHPEEPRITTGTINKQLGAVQAIGQWAYSNGVMPDDTPWSDPFARMRLEVDQSGRTSFVAAELSLIFASPTFTRHEYPVGGRGPAAYWLPILALFSGARQAELAGLTVASIQREPETQTPLLCITAQESRGRRLKSKAAERAIPIHPELMRLGLLDYAEAVRGRDGPDAWLFPEVAPGEGRPRIAAWSQWLGKYLRAQGVEDPNKVFHSFRHGFKDAMTQKSVDGELRRALLGHSWGAEAHGGYGGKTMLIRFGIETMSAAIAKVTYRGLDLAGVLPLRGQR